MSSKLKSLSKLAGLYSIVENMQALSLQRAATSLREVEKRIEQQMASSQTAKQAGKSALERGDRTDWLMTESQSEVALWNKDRLDQLRLQREELKQEIEQLHRQSLLQRDQLDAVVAKVQRDREVELQRLDQDVADDRHLSRLRWLEKRNASRMNRS